MLSHTPPSFSGSYDMRPSKRARAGSISGRLRSASDLCEEGLISHHQKGVLKVRGRLARAARCPLTVCPCRMCRT